MLSEEVKEVFMNYEWPGNVRQLKNVIERAVVLTKSDRITLRELPEEFHGHAKKIKNPVSVKSLKDIERNAVTDALQMCGGNISKAARQLGISRKTFYKRMKEI